MIELSEELKMIQKTARDYAQNSLKKIAAEIDKKKMFPQKQIKELAELGFLGMLIPEQYGGNGLGNLALVLLLIELNKVCASTGIIVSVHNSLCCEPIAKFGTEEQKKKFLPKMASGEIIGAYSLTEPSSGSDAAALMTKAEKKGEYYILNGQKVFVTNGKEAGIYILFARTSYNPSKKSEGICAFIIERDTPGLMISKEEEKMGIRGSSTVSLFLEDCKVPAKNLLGEEGKGFKIALDTLNGGRIGVAAQAIGITEGCLEESIKYAKTRKQFGQPIAEFESIQWKLADMATNLEAAKLLTYKAAILKDKDAPHIKEAAMAKLFASTLANKSVQEAVQIHGGVGYTTEFPVERFFRDARITELYEGTTEVQKIVISRQLLNDFD